MLFYEDEISCVMDFKYSKINLVLVQDLKNGLTTRVVNKGLYTYAIRHCLYPVKKTSTTKVTTRRVSPWAGENLNFGPDYSYQADELLPPDFSFLSDGEELYKNQFMERLFTNLSKYRADRNSMSKRI